LRARSASRGAEPPQIHKPSVRTPRRRSRGGVERPPPADRTSAEAPALTGAPTRRGGAPQRSEPTQRRASTSASETRQPRASPSASASETKAAIRRARERDQGGSEERAQGVAEARGVVDRTVERRRDREVTT